LNFNLSFYGIDDTRGDEYDDDEFGTANSLKLLKDKIVSDCMIVSCDLIASINIQSMANFYRVNNASFVTLLADVIEQNSELPVPGSKGKFAPGS
jgi:translation initiation factor eIF-2B subunit gamma